MLASSPIVPLRLSLCPPPPSLTSQQVEALAAELELAERALKDGIEAIEHACGAGEADEVGIRLEHHKVVVAGLGVGHGGGGGRTRGE